MVAENDFVIPAWPDGLQHVDVVKARFVIDFISPCQVQPGDFLELGRLLRLAARPLLDSCNTVAIQQWKALFQPSLSEDPVARRKFQKPAPAFVVTMPIVRKTLFNTGDQLALEVLFIGTGIPFIHTFLRSLIHLGHLGLVAGEGRFAVAEVFSRVSGQSEGVAWRHSQPLETLTCSVQPLTWLIQEEQVAHKLNVRFTTPTRLMVDGKPLRKPHFKQVFPFMLRRVTSMLHAHSGIEVLDDPTYMLDLVQSLDVAEAKLHWQDWRPLSGRQGMTVGGFLGEMALEGQAIQEVYWVFAVASLLGIGKGATYGAGRFVLCS